jgi:ABC-type multidrug transport system fused ATPase/permease subunit
LTRCHLTTLLRPTNDAKEDALNIPISQGSLSAGEKQLVAIARAILRRTNIIIMDEATSQIDSYLDDQVSESLVGVPMTNLSFRQTLDTEDNPGGTF